MTTYAIASVTCSICRTSIMQPVLASTNEFGSRDLDLRPAPMIRSTMNSWVQRCPGCGLCADSLDKAPTSAAATVCSNEYRDLLCDPTALPELARRFRAESLVTERAGDLATAADRALCAAWACDDANEIEAAIECRNHAIRLFLGIAGSDLTDDIPEPDTLNLLLTDLLRRSGRFDEARARCQLALQTVDQVMRAVAWFQLALLDRQDTAVHRIEEAVES